jgi:hypothetical protein
VRGASARGLTPWLSLLIVLGVLFVLALVTARDD